MTRAAIVVRPFAQGDQHATRALILHGLGDRFGFIDETLNPDLDDIAAHYLAEGHHFLVALCQQTLVGTGALLLQSDQIGQIVRVSTDRAYRRQGIAFTICLQLINLAHQHGLSRLIVETTCDWSDAIRLYQKLGFVEYQRVRRGVSLERNLT